MNIIISQRQRQRILIEQLIPLAYSINFGDISSEVKDLQSLLKFIGSKWKIDINLGTTGPNEDGIDGEFGRKTQTAISTIQGKYGLTPTGLYDEKTKKLIEKLVGFDNPLGKQYFRKSATSGLSQNFKKPSETGSSQNKKNTKKVEAEPKKENLKQNYRYSPRIDAELQKIKDRYSKENQGLTKIANDTKKLFGYEQSTKTVGFGKPFFIYDPKFNLLYLFDENYNYVLHTSVVDGADMQKSRSEQKVFDINDWCKVSVNEKGEKLLISPHKCTDPSTKEYHKPNYWILKTLESRFIPKGIYSISYLSRNEGYTGKGKNDFFLKDSEGKELSAAIHGIPNIDERLKASKALEEKLKTDISNGTVPQEYLASAKLIANANQSFGCVGVPAKFVENPKVVSSVKVGCAVFILGEGDKDYLVMDSNEYFDKLGGNGEDCQNPEMLATNMSQNYSDIA